MLSGAYLDGATGQGVPDGSGDPYGSGDGRRQSVQRLRLDEAVAAVVAETGVAHTTWFRRKRPALIDAEIIRGVPSVEAGELAAAHNRIARLEAELMPDYRSPTI
jgi:hypothetical protein